MQYAIGIDIGGTNTKLGLVTQDGVIHKSTSFSTRAAHDFDSYAKLLCKEINSIIATSSGTCLGIGIGAPNANYHTGSIEFAPNMPFVSAPMVSELQKILHLEKIYLTNDANAAALGEKIYGGAKDISDFIMITLGTGLGSGIVCDNKLLYGSTGFAGELGHTVAVPEGRLCNCGKRGCLENYASATGIKRTFYEKLAEYNGKSSIAHIPFDKMTSKIIEDAARDGDILCKECFDYTGFILGRSFADFVEFSSPKAIFLFGGLAKSRELIFEPTKASMERHLLKVFRNKVEILPSLLPSSDAAVLGASALVWETL